MKVDFFEIDRRYIYLFIFLALLIPLITGYTTKPARMKSAEKIFNLIEETKFDDGDIAFLALDFGPNTIGENRPQAEVIIEHLMRKRVPIMLFSQYILSSPLLKSIPESIARRLMEEIPGESWEYGKDWVNVGYKPGGSIFVQGIPKSDDIVELFKSDVQGNNLKDLPALNKFKSFNQIKILAQFTGLTGTLNTFIQFFQTSDYRPEFIHGCTSITIPEAYIYLDSSQLKGLLEGIAGAAWYSELLKSKFPDRKEDDSLIANTMLGVAHLVIIFFIIFGNLVYFLSRNKTNES